MELHTSLFSPARGWSTPLDTRLDSERTLALVFAAPRYAAERAPLDQLRAALPHSHIVGCSTAGEVHGDEVEDGSLTVAIARFDSTEVRHRCVTVENVEASFDAGQELARALCGPELRAILVLSDGLSVNGSELVRGINTVAPPSVIVTGGLAGDGVRFQETWVLGDSGPAARQVCAVGFYGPNIRVGHGSRGGWDVFGPERLVTRSKGNVLYELDGKPALDLYKNYLGDRADELPASALLFPLAVRENAESNKVLVRTVLSVDATERSLTFAGDVPQGQLARLMRANFDQLIEGAADAAQRTCAAQPQRNSAQPCDMLSIAISCVGRRMILGERTEEELGAVLEHLPSHARQVGFYSYGEISPYLTGHCDLHNQTMTLTTLFEVSE